MSHNVITVVWNDKSKAFQAFSEVKKANDVRVNQAGVYTRGLDGRLTEEDAGSATAGTGLAGGSLIGALVGVLGGPLGVLLGFSTGALFGSLADAATGIDDDSVLAGISAAIRPGQTALVLDVEEGDPSVINNLVAASGGVLFRHSYDDVLAEVQSAEDAADAAVREARKVVKEGKKAERKAEREQKWETTKAKFKSFFS